MFVLFMVMTMVEIITKSMMIMIITTMMTMTLVKMMKVITMMMTAAGCTAFLPWAAFVKCHRGAKFTFTNDSTTTTRALH